MLDLDEIKAAIARYEDRQSTNTWDEALAARDRVHDMGEYELGELVVLVEAADEMYRRLLDEGGVGCNMCGRAVAAKHDGGCPLKKYARARGLE